MSSNSAFQISFSIAMSALTINDHNSAPAILAIIIAMIATSLYGDAKDDKKP